MFVCVMMVDIECLCEVCVCMREVRGRGEGRASVLRGATRGGARQAAFCVTS